MADENETGAGAGENIEFQSNPVEDQAREQGWVPKDDFKGEEHKWVDAGEFLRRGELFGKIESQNKELKAIRETLAQFKDHHSKVQEAAYKKAVADLKAQKKAALIDGDADLVIEVDEQLLDIKQEQTRITSQPAQTSAEDHPEFVAFKNKNSWYENVYPMRRWADARGEELAREGKSPSDVLRTIEREAREEFPKRFENPNRSKASGVENGTQRGNTTAGRYQPSEIEERMATKFVREGLFKNKEEYYAELKANNS